MPTTNAQQIVSATSTTITDQSASPAIIVTHLSKKFRTTRIPKFLRPWSYFMNSPTSDEDPDAVTAIKDLSFVVPRGGIFILLGSNGAGKSTALGILAGLIGRSGGNVVFPPHVSPHHGGLKDSETDKGPEMVNGKQAQGEWDGPAHPPKGVLGIVPQKNVLFPELTCLQTIQLWRDIKQPYNLPDVSRGAGMQGYLYDKNEGRSTHVHVERTNDELEKLLVDCGLAGRVHANAGSLSGGQKRKLQLAIGLVGGSESKSPLIDSNFLFPSPILVN
jgi:ABC-type multidrug transport system ATPase subunit